MNAKILMFLCQFEQMCLFTKDKVKNEGIHNHNSLYHSWIVYSCDGDTALCQNV